jgi:2-polyprenyl-3-methyl-5-hydroxy-6-metoxy-1,4-benzoquinol methylase
VATRSSNADVGLLVPARRPDHEILDGSTVDAATRIRSITDVTRSNRLFGGRMAAVAAVEHAIGERRDALTLLDVGTGLADIPEAIVRRFARRGVVIRSIGLDVAADLFRGARQRLAHGVCGSLHALPFRDNSIDIVLCSQLLHHFGDTDLATVIMELDRVARRSVIVADLRRSWVAAAGFWCASYPLRFHPVTRHDGVLSVLRGFTGPELRSVILDAVGTEPLIRRRLGFRLTASWTPIPGRASHLPPSRG